MKIGAGWSCGVAAMTIVALLLSWQQPTEKQVGFTHQQLKEMKAECEKDLPRSTECSITVYYLPQAEQLEEVE